MTENTLLAGLSASEQQRLMPYLSRVQLRSGDRLVSKDGPIPYVWFLEDAVASVIVDVEEGKRVEVGIVGSEGMVGLSLLLGETESNTLVAVQFQGSANRMRSDDFLRHVVEGPGELHGALLRYANAYIAVMGETAACNSVHTIDKRVARWLLILHDRAKRNAFRLTQKSLSLTLGVRRGSISVAASRLQKSGSIKYTRGAVTIVDRAALERAACPCYCVIERLMDKPIPFVRLFSATRSDGNIA